MWLITPVGFYSIVQKPDDRASNNLTIRARSKSDLEALQSGYLPTLGEILESRANDYRFRAVADKNEVSKAVSSIIVDIDYNNFKSRVLVSQGKARANLYHDVWEDLYRIQER